MVYVAYDMMYTRCLEVCLEDRSVLMLDFKIQRLYLWYIHLIEMRFVTAADEGAIGVCMRIHVH